MLVQTHPRLSSFLSALVSPAVTALIAKNVGPEAFTVYALVDVFIGLTNSLITGVQGAESVLTAQAIGMKNSFLAGQYAQLTVLLYILIAIPTYTVWVFCAPKIVDAWGFDLEIVDMVRSYVPIAALRYL